MERSLLTLTSHTRPLETPPPPQLSILLGSLDVCTFFNTIQEVCRLLFTFSNNSLILVLSDNYWLIGEDKTLNPKKYFIIVPALFGNGQSTSPSNYAHPGPFPKCSFYDNVRAQHQLVTQHLKITHVRAVIGWSMGAAQTYQWATQYPDFMDLAVPFCGSAKTSLHNKVFLEGVKSALLAAKHIPSAGSGNGGLLQAEQSLRTWSDTEKEVGLKAFGRGYAGW